MDRIKGQEQITALAAAGRHRLRVGVALTRAMALAAGMLVTGVVLAACGGVSSSPGTTQPAATQDSTAEVPTTAIELPEQMPEDLAPSFTFTLFQGHDELGSGPLTPADLRGKPLVINFWAGLCPPCRAELPDFQEYYQEFGDRVNLVAVDLGQFTGLGSLQDAKDLLEELDITFPAASTDDNSVIEAYRVLVLPSTVFIDADGSIFKHWQSVLNLAILEDQTLKMLGE